MYFLPGEIFDISTFNIRQKKWCSFGEIRLKIGEAIAHGGMRRAMKAVVLKCHCDQKNRGSDFERNGRTFSIETKWRFQFLSVLFRFRDI